jgi:hypothetical protein
MAVAAAPTTRKHSNATMVIVLVKKVSIPADGPLLSKTERQMRRYDADSARNAI